MISRTLVPVDVRPVKHGRGEEARRTRTTTYMDDRTVVPSGPSDAPPLDGKSNIPQHLPLGVLVNRTLVRARHAGQARSSGPNTAPEPLPLDILDSRVVVPATSSRWRPRKLQNSGTRRN